MVWPGPRLRTRNQRLVRMVPLDGALLVTGAVMILLAVNTAREPAAAVFIRSPVLESVVFSSLIVVGFAISVLAWTQWHDGREVAALYESSAFLLATAVNAIVAPMVYWQASGAERPEIPWTTMTLAPAAIGGLLMVGAARALRGHRPSRVVVPLVLICPIALVGSVVVGASALDAFGVHAQTMQRLLLDVEAYRPVQIVAQLSIVVVFLVGALLYRRLYVTSQRVVSAFISVALVVGAGSQARLAVVPEVVTGVTIDDALRFALFAIVLAGYAVQMRRDVRALRRSNRAIERSGKGEIARATLEERSRFAREIHDGVAQDIAAVRLRIRGVREAVGHDRRLDVLVTNMDDALGRALMDTRRLMESLRRENEGQAPVPTALRVSDLEPGASGADRIGYRRDRARATQ